MRDTLHNRTAMVLVLLAVVIGLPLAAAQAEVVYIRGTRCRDAYVDKWAANQNFGNAKFLRVSNGYGSGGQYKWDKRTLVRFDLANVPSGARVVRAQLYLYYYAYWDTKPVGRKLNCYRNTRSWVESAVTWNYNRPSHASKKTASASVPARFGWMAWDVTTDAANMHGNYWSNYGWTIQDDRYWGHGNIPVPHFYAREKNTNKTPYLKVTYQWGDGIHPGQPMEEEIADEVMPEDDEYESDAGEFEDEPMDEPSELDDGDQCPPAPADFWDRL